MLRIQIFLIGALFSHSLCAIKLVKLTDIIPNLVVEMPYKTEQNFTHKKVYPANADAYLLPEVAGALAQVQKDLNKQGLGLLVRDAYRPLPVQKIFWDICPNEKYVMPPTKGSRHNKGAAVDVTLICLSDGQELNMPTKFDDFSESAWKNATTGLTKERIQNKTILAQAMEARGFTGMKWEWWHFDWAASLEHPEKYLVLRVDFDELEHDNT